MCRDLLKKVTRKKFQGLAAAVLSVTLFSAFAGGWDRQGTHGHVTYSGTYLEGNVGYASRDWGPTVAGLNQSGLTWSNKDGGVVAGVTVGQQFNKYIALEAGWEYLPEVKLTFFGTLTDKVNSWMAYTGPKLMIPLFRSAFLFVKGGVSYVYNKNHPPIAVSSQFAATKSNYWSGFVGAGLQYYFTPSFSASLQAAYVPGYNGSAQKFRVPATYYYVGVLGYKFMV